MQLRKREDLAEQLLKRAQESYERKEDSGMFGTIFKPGIKANFFKCTEGEHVIDIMLWATGKNYPTKNYPNVAPGDPAYVLDVWVHQKIGVNEDTYVCPARNYNDPCPICEDVNKLRKEEVPDKDRIKELIPKRRAIYYIVCYDSDAIEDKGVQIWDVAYFFMEMHLAELAKKPKGGGYVLFAHPDQGKQIFFKRRGSGQTNTSFIAHQFLDRSYKISDEILSQCPSLDELIVVVPYEDLLEAHIGKKDAAKETAGADPSLKDEPSPSARRVREMQAGPASPDPPLEKEAPAETAVETKTETEPAPRGLPLRRRGIPQAESAAPAAEKAPEAEKAPAAASTAESNVVCPGKGTFGTDVDTLSHCGACVEWDSCASESDRKEKAAKATKG